MQGELKTYELTDYEKSTEKILKAYFENGLPEEKEISDCEEIIAKYKENEIKIAANELTEEEKLKKAKLDKFFENRDSDESEIDIYFDKISKLNDLNGNITTEKSKLDILKNIQSMNTPQQKDTGKTKNTLTILSILIAVIGIALLFISLPAGVGVIVLGGVLFVFAKMMDNNQKSSDNVNNESTTTNQQDSTMEIQKLIDDLAEQKNSIEEELNNFLLQFPIQINSNNYYSSLNIIKTNAIEYRNIITKFNNQESIAIKNKQDDLIKNVDGYLKEYCDDLGISIEQKENIWRNVKNRRIEYIEISKKLSKYEQLNSKFESFKGELSNLLKIYFNELYDNLSENINILKDRRKEYERLSNELAKSKIEKEQFEKENDVQSLKNIETPEYNLNELRDNEKTLDHDLESIINKENDAKEQIRKLSDDADKCPGLQGEIEQLQEELSLGEKRLDILNKTIQCLENAKDNFATHYMNGMNQGFEQYINMLDNGTLGDTNMDVQLNVNISAHGSQKSLDYFSTGYKDLIGIATRFALVDALFENENPFIILDDPFTNLDGEKLNNALEMIEKIANKYQIIYFVCHDSRVASIC